MKNISILLLLISLSFQSEINSFKKYVYLADDCQDLSFLPNEENMKIIGRFYKDKNNIAWIAHSGSALEFYITGKYAEIILVGDSNIYSKEDLRPRFAIYINDELFLDSLMNDLVNYILNFLKMKKKKKI